MADNIKELEKSLEKVEHDLKDADWEEGFDQVLKQYRGEDEVVSFKKYIELNKGKKSVGFSSGFSKLDGLIDGFHEGDLITITAPTGEGKTTFCQNLTVKFIESGVKSIWFSYEVPIDQFIIKFGDEVPEGYLPKQLVSRTITWIERKIVEGIVKYGVRVVFIDHLHYLFNLSTSRNPSLEIGEIVRNLKTMAKKYKVTIFLVAHIGKIGYGERVGLENIRDSSFVGQESDYVIAMWRTKERLTKKQEREEGPVFKNEAVLSVVKNRYNGRLGGLKLFFHDNKFYENIDEVPVLEM